MRDWCAVGQTYCDAAPTTEPGGRTVAARPTWDEYGLILAQAVSQRADCRRSLVGAVIMEDRTHRILSCGYNGTTPGRTGCLAGACPRGLLDPLVHPPGGLYVPHAVAPCIATHAEENALNWARDVYPARDSYGFEDCTIYVTREPCAACRTLCERNALTRFVYL